MHKRILSQRSHCLAQFIGNIALGQPNQRPLDVRSCRFLSETPYHTVTVILINSGNFQDCYVSVPGKTTDSGATEHSNIITAIATLQSCN